MRILIVEDDRLLGEGILAGIKQAGFAADWVQDGAAGLAALQSEPFSAVVLDLGLPRLSGLDVLRQLRATHNPTPVLILTARDTPQDVIAGLDAGADDYMIKPFALDELTARVRALLRRRAGRGDPVLRHGPIAVDPATREVTLDGTPVNLSAREYALLLALLDRPGAVLSRGQLEERIYGWGEEVGSNAVEVHVHALRRKLGADRIRTVRGVGYALAQAQAA